MPTTLPPPVIALPARPQRLWRRELAYFGAAYLVYVTARWIFAGEPGPAHANAAWIWELELATGTAIERSVQEAFSGAAMSWLLSHVYLAAQLAVVPAALVWLFRNSPRIYRPLRTTVIATWLLSVPVFALFPVAPPRLADLGLADTVSSHAAVALNGSSTMFYNPLAAVPSLHVGLAFAVGIAAVAAARTPWAKVLAGLWGPIVTLTVVATANHYVFDVAAGLLVTAAGYGVWVLHSRRGTAAPPRPAPGTWRLGIPAS